MKTSFASLTTLLASGLLATACGNTKFSQSSGVVRDGIGALTGDESQSGKEEQVAATDAADSTATSQEGTVPAELKSQQTSDEGEVAATVQSEEVKGWSLTCNGNLFKGVFGVSEPEVMGLLGWSGASGAGSADVDGKSDRSKNGAFALLDSCVDLDLVDLRAKGLQYVIVKFHPESFNVTDVKAYHPSNFANANVADYNSCAKIAGAPAANANDDAIESIVSSSLLSGTASCGTGGCCIDIK